MNSMPTTQRPRVQVTDPDRVVGEDLGNRLEAKGVELEGRASATSWAAYIMAFAPILLLIGFFVWTVRRSRGTGGFSAMQQSKARVIDEQRPDVRFADVAGYEGVKSELSEVIEFLRDPARFKRLGANGSKAVLMLGPPGTGKTLFARRSPAKRTCPSSLSPVRPSSRCSWGSVLPGCAICSTAPVDLRPQSCSSTRSTPWANGGARA